jgi:hypothetical protein
MANDTGVGGTMTPEEMVLTSPLRKCRMSVSPYKFMLTSEDLPFDDFVQLASGVQSKLAGLYKDIVIGYVGAVVRVSGVKSKTPPGDTKGRLESSIAGTIITDVIEFRASTLKQGQRQHILVRPLRDSTAEVTLDVQKTEDAMWNDLVTLPAKAREMLETLVAEMEQK